MLDIDEWQTGDHRQVDTQCNKRFPVRHPKTCDFASVVSRPSWFRIRDAAAVSDLMPCLDSVSTTHSRCNEGGRGQDDGKWKYGAPTRQDLNLTNHVSTIDLCLVMSTCNPAQYLSTWRVVKREHVLVPLFRVQCIFLVPLTWHRVIDSTRSWLATVRWCS